MVWIANIVGGICTAFSISVVGTISRWDRQEILSSPLGAPLMRSPFAIVFDTG